jgi:drug/metabolite transporter (DMT)-like permease
MLKNHVSLGEYRKAVAALFLGTVFWGGSFVLIKVLDDFQAPLAASAGVRGEFLSSSQLFLRYFLAAILLGFVLLWKKNLQFRRSEFVVGLGSGFFSACGMLLQTDGLRFTTASISAFLTQAFCILIPLLELIFRKRLPSRKTLFCCFLLTMGIVILSKISWDQFHLGRGEIETLLSAIFFAGHIFWLDVKAQDKNDPLRISLVYFSTLIVIMFLFSLLFLPKSFDQVPWVDLFLDTRTIWSVLLLGLFCTFGSFILMNTFQPRIPPSVAGLIYSLEPVVAGVLALFVPAWISGLWNLNYQNEILSSRLLWGGGIMIAANVIMQINFRKFLLKMGIENNYREQ